LRISKWLQAEKPFRSRLTESGRVNLKMRRRATNYLRGIHEPAKQETVVPISKPKTSGNETKLHRALFGSSTKVAAFSSAAVVALLLAVGSNLSWAEAAGSPATSASAKLSPEDYNFVAQANLGAPFQIDSGRVTEKGATTANIRNYAHLMVVTHIPVVDALNEILQRKNIEAPPNTLLRGAYRTMVSSLKSEHGAALDRDYVEGQVDYQKGNEALFRGEIENGSDPDLKDFARKTLPKIVDHLDRALKLAAEKTAAR
jgi:putative membrane protein